MVAPARRERNIQQIGTMYEKTFVTLTERFFKGVPWPPVELLAVLVDHDHVFCMLYKVRPSASNPVRRTPMPSPLPSGAHLYTRANHEGTASVSSLAHDAGQSAGALTEQRAVRLRPAELQL